MNAEIGTKFGRWTTLIKVLRIDGRSYIRCKCDCGTVKKVHANDLERGKSKSCGPNRGIVFDINGPEFKSKVILMPARL